MQKPTIYDIKNGLTEDNQFFSRNNLKFFGQTMKSFKVYKTGSENKFIIEATIKNKLGQSRGSTRKYAIHLGQNQYKLESIQEN